MLAGGQRCTEALETVIFWAGVGGVVEQSSSAVAICKLIWYSIDSSSVNGILTLLVLPSMIRVKHLGQTLRYKESGLQFLFTNTQFSCILFFTFCLRGFYGHLYKPKFMNVQVKWHNFVVVVVVTCFKVSSLDGFCGLNNPVQHSPLPQSDFKSLKFI